MRRVALLALLLSPLALPAQQANPPGKPLTPEALLGLRRLGELESSPDGSRVAFVVAEPPQADKRPRHIWLYETAAGSVRQLTYSEKNEGAPHWSPDGKWLAFLSNRDGEQQIYLLPMSGGEAYAITKGKRSIERFFWSPDGKQIAFIAPDAKTEAEEKREKEKDDARVEDYDDKHPRVWLLDLATKSARALTPPNYAVSEVAWCPDGKSLALIATDHPESDRDTERIYLVTGDATPATPPRQLLAPRGPIGNLAVSPNGTTISFVASPQDGPSAVDLWLLPVGMPSAKNLTAATLDRPVFAYRWQRDNGILLFAEEGFSTRIVRFTAAGALEEIPVTGTRATAFTADAAGRIVFVGEDFTQPQELWSLAPGAAARKLTDLNKSFAEFAVSEPQLYRYKSFDGQAIEAAILKPASPVPGKRLPLITLVHGGPTGAWQRGIDSWGQLLAARGYAVFYPNIRGSSGYGERFLESNRADWGGGDFKDVMAGVDDLIAQGVADPERLGIGGWSYGGYMSEWAVTQTTRFKAAVSGAGMANLISEYGTEEHPSYDEWFWGLPYEKPEGFLNHSPFLFLKNARTPTLVLQGDADPIDPIGQSQELYRGLKRYGSDSRLVIYPRETHGFREEKHLIDRLNRVVAWYDKFLK